MKTWRGPKLKVEEDDLVKWTNVFSYLEKIWHVFLEFFYFCKRAAFVFRCLNFATSSQNVSTALKKVCKNF